MTGSTYRTETNDDGPPVMISETVRPSPYSTSSYGVATAAPIPWEEAVVTLDNDIATPIPPWCFVPKVIAEPLPPKAFLTCFDGQKESRDKPSASAEVKCFGE